MSFSSLPLTNLPLLTPVFYEGDKIASKITVINDISNKNLLKACYVEQGEFKIIKASDPSTLWTNNLKTCIGVVAIGLDREKNQVNRGLAHLDDAEDTMLDMLEEMKDDTVHTFHLYAIGGFCDYTTKKDNPWNSLLSQIRTAKVSVAIFHKIANPYQVKHRAQEIRTNFLKFVLYKQDYMPLRIALLQRLF